MQAETNHDPEPIGQILPRALMSAPNRATFDRVLAMLRENHRKQSPLRTKLEKLKREEDDLLYQIRHLESLRRG